MEQSELFSRLGVALAIGLLVGLERGWSKRDAPDHQRAAGFRTFALSGLLGGVAGVITLSTSSTLLGLVFIAYAAAFTAFHWLEATADHDLSVTSVIAGLLTFLLGALAILGDIGVAVASAVAMTVLLAFREQLHRWVAALVWVEISSVLILLAMTFLLLPLLPNHTIDPWDAINPHDIWLLTILIATVSFTGYVAMKIFGDRMGLLLAAIAGGLASSTATTLTLARMGSQRPEAARLVSAGILLAGLVMMVRVAGVTLVLNPALAVSIATPLAIAAAVQGLSALVLSSERLGAGYPQLAINNPLAIGTALRLGAIIAAVMLGAGYLRSSFSSIGILLVAAVSGIVDADAITISMARLGGNGLDPRTAANAILVGVAVNTVAKAVMAGTIAGRKIGLYVGTVSFLALALGLFAQLGPL
ncbi:MAG TPA: MgtC/SapB family protein [Devosia sp.]|nr:MgtC/SapB family protein [Devosia sp.]